MRISIFKEAAVIVALAAVLAVLYNGFAENGLGLVYKKTELQPGSTLSLAELHRALAGSDAVLIDARGGEEFANGHIPGARSLPLNSPRNTKILFLSKFSKTTVFILYCVNAECTQAERLAKQFHLLGFSNTLIFSGGWEEWRKAGENAQ